MTCTQVLLLCRCLYQCRRTNVTNKSSSTITIAMITIWLLGTGSGERRGRGHRSLPVPGARLQRGRCLPVTHAPTPGQPAVTPHCRDEWQMVLSLEGRRTGSRPPAGLCETVGHMDSDGPLAMHCHNSWSALWRGPGQAPPWAEMRVFRPNSLKTKKILAI